MQQELSRMHCETSQRVLLIIYLQIQFLEDQNKLINTKLSKYKNNKTVLQAELEKFSRMQITHQEEINKQKMMFSEMVSELQQEV